MNEKKDIKEKFKDKKLLVDQLPKEEWRTFVWAVAEGESTTEAYLRAYPHVKRETAWTNGCRLLRDARVAAALDEILSELSRANMKRLKGLQAQALRVLARAQRGEDVSKIQLEAAKDILDRTGLIRREAFEHEIKGRNWADLMGSTE